MNYEVFLRLTFIWLRRAPLRSGSFAPPKEMNQRKRGRKSQPHLVFRLLRNAISRSKNRVRFAPFPVCPRTFIPLML